MRRLWVGCPATGSMRSRNIDSGLVGSRPAGMSTMPSGALITELAGMPVSPKPLPPNFWSRTLTRGAS